jgi:uncharacterized protein YcnI
MRTARVSALLLLSVIGLLMLATTGVAWAHVVVSPEEVPADSYQVLTVRAPTEKEIPTTEIRVEVPQGFTVTGVRPVPGWQSEFEEDGGIIRAITWSGGEIQPREFQEFALQARTPPETGEYSWSAYQTYEDGSVVEWTGPPEEHGGGEEESEDSGPASVVDVVQGGAQPEESPGVAAPEAGLGFIPIAAYGGLGLGILALVVALVALIRSLRRA